MPNNNGKVEMGVGFLSDNGTCRSVAYPDCRPPIPQVISTVVVAAHTVFFFFKLQASCACSLVTHTTRRQ